MLKRKISPQTIRSRAWINNPDDAKMTALYVERYLKYGQTPWQQYFREKVATFSEGMVLDETSNYKSIANKF